MKNIPAQSRGGPDVPRDSEKEWGVGLMRRAVYFLLQFGDAHTHTHMYPRDNLKPYHAGISASDPAPTSWARCTTPSSSSICLVCRSAWCAERVQRRHLPTPRTRDRPGRCVGQCGTTATERRRELVSHGPKTAVLDQIRSRHYMGRWPHSKTIFHVDLPGGRRG